MKWFSKWSKSPPLPPEAVVAEFLAFIREHDADVPLALDGEALKIGAPDTDIEHTMFLGKLLHDTSEIPSSQAEKRREIYARWWSIATAEDGVRADLEAGFEALRERIFPKLVQPAFLRQIAEQGLATGDVPHQPFGETPFLVVYVLDYPDRVAYILGKQADEMGATHAQIRDAAMENARRLFPREQAREMVESRQASVMWCGEGHNSCRPIVLPEYLGGDEEAAVVLPDRDQFILTLAPPDNNWNPLRQMCREPYALPQPLLVRAGRVVAM